MYESLKNQISSSSRADHGDIMVPVGKSRHIIFASDLREYIAKSNLDELRVLTELQCTSAHQLSEGPTR